jgi:hypothetical protein
MNDELEVQVEHITRDAGASKALADFSSAFIGRLLSEWANGKDEVFVRKYFKWFAYRVGLIYFR